jgi:hypothetical protein
MSWELLTSEGLVPKDVRSIVALRDGTVAIAQNPFKLACPSSGTTNGAIFRLRPNASVWEDITGDRYCNTFCYARGEEPGCVKLDRFNGELAVLSDRSELYLKQNNLFRWREGQGGWVSETGAGDPYGSRSVVGESYYLVIGGRQLRQDSASTTVYSRASNYSTFQRPGAPGWHWCKHLDHVFSPDGGRTFYAEVRTGYADGDVPGVCDWSQRSVWRGIHRLVVDPCRMERSNNLDVGFGTYLGSSESHDASIAGLQVVPATADAVPPQEDSGLITSSPEQDGQHVLVAGNWGNIPSIGHSTFWPLEAPGYNATSEAADAADDGAPVAQMARISPSGRLYAVSRFGNATMKDFGASAAGHGNPTSSLSLAAWKRQLYLALEGQGVLAVSPNGTHVGWRTCSSRSGNEEPSDDASSRACCPAGLPCRVSASEDGALVAVLSGKQARVFDARTGAELARTKASLLSGQSYVEDVAVSGDEKKLYVTGFNNRFNGGIPVQIAFVFAYDLSAAA